LRRGHRLSHTAFAEPSERIARRFLTVISLVLFLVAGLAGTGTMWWRARTAERLALDAAAKSRTSENAVKELTLKIAEVLAVEEKRNSLQNAINRLQVAMSPTGEGDDQIESITFRIIDKNGETRDFIAGKQLIDRIVKQDGESLADSTVVAQMEEIAATAKRIDHGWGVRLYNHPLLNQSLYPGYRKELGRGPNELGH